MSRKAKKILIALVLTAVAVLAGPSFSMEGLKNTLSGLASAVWGS